jgi:CxxC-x17-CxxC domain-containing protein
LDAGAAGSHGGQRTETHATCSQCGKPTTVPFRPTQGRPVYCRDCFQQRRSMGASTGAR